MARSRIRQRLSAHGPALAAGAVGGGLAFMVAGALLLGTGGLNGDQPTVTVEHTTVVVAAGGTAQRGLPAQAIYARDAAGVVSVNATGVSQPESTSEAIRGEGGQQGAATGSGFEVDHDGSIVTCWHVVENASTVLVGVEGGRTLRATVIAQDPSRDLAVLHISPNGLKLDPLTVANANPDHLKAGEPVFAIGNPFGLGGTLTTGVISALNRQITTPNGAKVDNALQTDASINPGDSGGPLLNALGEVLAVNSQIETTGGASVGVAFAIPIAPGWPQLDRLLGRTQG